MVAEFTQQVKYSLLLRKFLLISMFPFQHLVQSVKILILTIRWTCFDPYQDGHILFSLRLGFPLPKKNFPKNDAIILIFLEIKTCLFCEAVDLNHTLLRKIILFVVKSNMARKSDLMLDDMVHQEKFYLKINKSPLATAQTCLSTCHFL